MRSPLAPIRGLLLAAGLAFAAIAAAITVAPTAGCFSSKTNPRYCDEDTPCTDPDTPFCDLTGAYNPDGVENRCVASPFDAMACEGPTDCTTATAPICDDTAGQCRGCESNAECEARDEDTPMCAEDGSCFAGCTESSECPAGAPICSDAQTCEACVAGSEGDADCAARDAATPRCASAGTCVECLDSADCATPTAPICDTAANQCRPCQLHTDCASEVCDLDTGACEEPGDIVYVDGDDGADGAGCGGQASPCDTIVGAQGGLAKVGGTRRTVRVRSSASPYTGQVDLDNIDVTIVGPGATLDPVSAGTPALRVRNGSTATIDGLTITGGNGGANGDGVLCRDSATSLRLRAVTIEGNSGQGIDAADGALAIERSTIGSNTGGGLVISATTSFALERSAISDNQGGGVSIANTPFTLRNNFIAGNGQSGAGGTILGGLSISNGSAASPQTLDFNTVTDNSASNTAFAAGAICTVTTPATASSNIVYGNVGGLAEIAGGCSWAYSDIEGGQSGTGNIDMDPLFVDAAGGDFHLTSSSPCRNAADPDATLAVDFDGDPRPEGSAPDMGADEVVP